MLIKAKKQTLNGRQKAAVFLISLGPKIASGVLKYLRQDEIEALTFEMARRDRVTPEEREQVLDEFNELMMAQEFITAGGIEYAREVLELTLGPDRAAEIINRLIVELKRPPFDFLRRTDPAHLLNFIQNEHPQTIALILCYLEPLMASHILCSLPHQVQADIARRIAVMERVSPEVLRETERVLAQKLSRFTMEDFSMTGGVDTAVEVLNLVDRGTERTIIEALEEEYPDLAEEIKKKMFVFEDIVLLDDRSIQRILREVEHQDLTRALKGVETEVREKIYTNMSNRAAALLRDELEFIGPVLIRDVEECQQKIVGLIRKLENDGDIVIARMGEEELIV